ARAVDGEAPSPAGTVIEEPVAHHAGLGQGERNEHPHGVQGDEGVRLATEEHDEKRGETTEDEDAVREHEPVALRDELAWRVAIAREQAGQAGEVGERRIRGQYQDEHGRALDEVVEEARAKESSRYL